MAERAEQERRMTLDEFLVRDDGTDTRYELVDGRVVAMNPPLPRHGAMLLNIGMALKTRLPMGCTAYAGSGTRREDDRHNYRIPDVAVSCTTSDQQWVEAPKLVVEVVSPSSKTADSGLKIDFYRGIETIDEILLVWPDQRRVTLWQRDGARWIVQDFVGRADVHLRTTTRPIQLDELYEPLDL